MPNPLTSSQFVRLLDNRLREVSQDTITEMHKKETTITDFYRTLDSQGAFEEFYEIGALPDIPEFNGKLEYLSVAPGYYVKIEPKEYAGGITFERKLLDDKKYSVMNDRAGMLANSAVRVQMKIAIRPFAYAFSSAFDYMNSEEGVALCSDSHTTKAGVSTSSGFDNAGTSALTPTAVEATRIAMRRFRNDIGERILIDPDTLVVPDSLEQKALEITQTDKGLYSAEGTKNVQSGRWKVKVVPRLDDYDTNNWFMTDSTLQKRFLVWIDRVKPEPNNTIDFETFQIKHSVYFRCANGFLNWRWIMGHAVT